MLEGIPFPVFALGEQTLKLTAFLALFFGAHTLAYSATNLDKAFGCTMSASQFFTPLVQQKLIESRPYQIEDSISYFRPINLFLGKTRGGMLVYGMQVDSVFGYARGQMFFLRGPGTEPAEVYGAIVRDGIANVQAQLNSMGITRARTNRVSGSLTAVICEGI